MGGGQVGGLNILPKKRWHVRTRENIARVRRDEAKAADEEKARQERAAFAEQEARTQFLKEKARKRLANEITSFTFDYPSTSASTIHVDVERKCATETAPQSHHVNFFAELEEQERTFGKNKEHEQEKKMEKEQEEIKLGMLRYLGDGSIEASKQLPWYEVAPKRAKSPSFKSDLPRTTAKGSHLRQEVGSAAAKAVRSVKPLMSEKLQSSSKVQGDLHKSHATSHKHSSKIKHHHRHRSSKKHRRQSKSHSSSKQRRHSKQDESSSESEWTSDANNGESAASPDDDSDHPSSSHKKKEVVNPVSDLERLRAQRLKREEQERQKARQLLKSLTAKPAPVVVEHTDSRKRKYNNQFNPEICRQNNPRDPQRHLGVYA